MVLRQCINIKNSLLDTKNKKGFSLIEFLVAIGIIGIILAATTIPDYSGRKDRARLDSVNSVLDSVAGALQICLNLKKGDRSKCDTWEKLGIKCGTLKPSNKRDSFPQEKDWSLGTSGNTDGIICTGTIVTPLSPSICIMVWHSKDPATKACVDSQGGEHKARKGAYRVCVTSGGDLCYDFGNP